MGRFQQSVGGDGPQATDEFWANDLQLTLEEATAVRDFVRIRIAVARRPALEHVEDVEL